MFQSNRRWSMDNFSLIQLADNCCPKLFKNFIGVASSDNFFSGRDFEQILDSAVTTGQKYFYQIVNSAAQTEAGKHWLLLSYILIDPSEKQALSSSDAIITIFLWDPLGEPIKIYRKIQKRLAALSSRTIRAFEITFPMQNPRSNLCGLYCLFMAHYLNEIHFAENVCTFLCKGSKRFTSKIQYFTNHSLSKLTTVSEIDIVRYFNIHCNCNLDIKFVILIVITMNKLSY